MKALRELSDAQRETIILRVWHDCSFQEIGEILGKSEASTKMLMKRGLVTLQTLMPKEFAAFVVLWEWLTVHG
jgi:DNA-directed RNA polymerase specialized sigma24 family protein